MTDSTHPRVAGVYKAQLFSDLIHASVVTLVVLATTILTLYSTHVPPDVVGTVFGGAIGYAAGRAGNVSRAGRFDDDPKGP